MALLLSLCLHLGILFCLNFTTLPRTEAGTGEIRTIAMVKLQGSMAPQVKRAALPIQDENAESATDSRLAPMVTGQQEKDHTLSDQEVEKPSVETDPTNNLLERPAEPRQEKAQTHLKEGATASSERGGSSSEVQEAWTSSSSTDPSPPADVSMAPGPETTKDPEALDQQILDPSSAGAIRRVKPFYPRASRLKHEEGEVIIILDIDNGRVMNVTVEISSGHSRLDEAAVKALWKWDFSYPGKAKVRVPVAFRLQE